MPELPEVETIRRGLEKYLLGKIIQDVEVRLAKQIIGDVEKIKGAKVQKVRRYGKGLVIDLENDFSLAVHIKMTGQLIYQDEEVSKVSKVSKEKVGILPHKHTHVIFYLNNQSRLYYNDVRQFGWIRILKTKEVSELAFFKTLGPEFLKDLTYEKFSQILTCSGLPIKQLLLQQEKMSGAGNIYANDGLYRAKIHPTRKAKTLTESERKNLFYALEEVLRKGIEVGGSSEWSYVNVLGEDGGYQKIFLVYGQDGKPCQRCGALIERIKLGGRGTFYCPQCQH